MASPGQSAEQARLATAADLSDANFTEFKLLPDEQELRRIIDLIPPMRARPLDYLDIS